MYNVIDHGNRIQVGINANEAENVVRGTSPSVASFYVDSSAMNKILAVRGSDLIAFLQNYLNMLSYVSGYESDCCVDLHDDKTVKFIAAMARDNDPIFGNISYGYVWIYKDKPEDWRDMSRGGYYDYGLVQFVLNNLVSFISYMDSTRTSMLIQYASSKNAGGVQLSPRSASVNTISGTTDTSIDLLKSILVDGGCQVTIKDGDSGSSIYLQAFGKDLSMRESAISNFSGKMSKSYMDAVKSVRGSMEDAIKRATDGLEQRLSEERSKIITATYATALDLKDRGWILRNNKLVYPDRVYVTKVQDVAGKVYNLPEDLHKDFYLENFTMNIGSTIRSVQAEGKNPHLASGYVCLGTLQGKDISYLRILPEMYETINYGSMYGGIGGIAVGILMGRLPSCECTSRGKPTCKGEECPKKAEYSCDGKGVKVIKEIKKWYKYANFCNLQTVKPTEGANVKVFKTGVTGLRA
jgi:hypothetical protein